MSELWSSQQHEWLKALGHTLYVPGWAEAPVAAAALPAVGNRPLDKRATDRPVVAKTSIPVPAAPLQTRRQPEPEVISTRVAEAPRRAESRLPDRLHFALIRASGCNPNAEESASIIAQWPPSSELRSNPAAKRALWPQLRKLRKPRVP